MSVKSTQIASSPAYIYQVLGCVDYFGRNPNTATYLGDRSALGPSGVFDPITKTWKARLINYMVGLKLLRVEDKRIYITDKAYDLYQTIEKLDNNEYDIYRVDNTNSKLKSIDGTKFREKLHEDKYFTLYAKLRDIFLDSYQFKCFSKYVYSHRFDKKEKKEFKRQLYAYINEHYDGVRIKLKTQEERSEKSSKADGSDNNMISLVDWLITLDFIKENDGVLYIMKDVKEIVKNKIENGGDHIIFTGAPGTGKTYSVIEYLNKQAKNRYKFVQFHSSFDYTDFVEGLRPAIVDGTRSFVKMDGLFKEFCRHVVETNIVCIIDSINNEAPTPTLDSLKGLLECRNYEELYRLMSSDLSDLSKTDTKIRKELIDYLNDLDDYYFFIDEINRADLSAVFGELLFALEESYKGLEHRFNTRYYALPTYELDSNGAAKTKENDCFNHGFFVPRNVRILGTMNNIDRSVESIDFALRRRFDWINIDADTVMDAAFVDMNLPKEYAEKAKELNRIISESDVGLNKDYHIGPAYYKGANSKEELTTIYYRKIEPLLNEYVRGRDDEIIESFLSDCEETLLGSSDA